MSALRILNVDDSDAARYVKHRILHGAGHEAVELLACARNPAPPAAAV
jgi:CheY-like chemotaxis protein